MSTPNTVKAQLQNLIDIANRVTGKSDTDLTGAVNTLINDRETLIDGSITDFYSDVTRLGSYRLAGNPNMVSVSLPNATLVKYQSLASNSVLKIVNLPSAKTLENYVFYNDSALETISLPSISEVDSRCFDGCTSLRYVNLHNVKGLGGNLFYGCFALQVLVFTSQNEVPILRNVNTFANSSIENGTGYIYVPRTLIDSYKTATNWTTFASQFRALEDYTVDGTITGEFDWNKIDGGSV